MVGTAALMAGRAFLVMALLATTGVSASAGEAGPYLVGKYTIAGPDGFNDVCRAYRWVCASGQASRLSDGDTLRLAQQVNRTVNEGTRQISDARQYRTREKWALPTARGGDCEDLVLLKKKTLTEAGVAPGNLLIATVLDHQQGRHAVLVLRTGQGDFVLDNLTSQILSWSETGYTFLRMQNPRSPDRWDAIFAGGLARKLT